MYIWIASWLVILWDTFLHLPDILQYSRRQNYGKKQQDFFHQILSGEKKES